MILQLHLDNTLDLVDNGQLKFPTEQTPCQEHGRHILRGFSMESPPRERLTVWKGIAIHETKIRGKSQEK